MSKSVDKDLDFRSQFYNLQGIHINERKKNFHKLLNSTGTKLPHDQIELQPRNYLEQIFYVEVLIYFKHVDKLIEVLKEGNEVLVKKILKQQWFFQEAFKNMTEEDIVNNFLPSLSYIIRKKVLKKLSLALGEERMDKIFDLILERYGLFYAKLFLFSCSSEKIINVLRSNEIILLSEQLKRLLQKDINVLKVYFEEYKKNKRHDFHDSNFFNYVAWKHPNLYFELGLHKKYIKLGRFTTRALIRNNRQEVLNDIYNSSWNKTAVVREIKDFDKQYLFKLFPADVKEIKNNYWSGNTLESYLLKYPVKKRWELLSQSFKQAYNQQIIEHLDKINETLIRFVPQEIKQKWAEIKYLENEALRYLKYCEPKKTVNLLKDKINVTADISTRAQFVHELISVCFENNDYSTYEEVLKYICVRHRNEDESMRQNLISHIARNIKYDFLTENHWKYINEIIDIQRIKEERLDFDVMSQYLLFVYLKKLPLDGPIKQYCEDCCNIGRSFRMLCQSKETERNILLHIVKILPTLQFEKPAQKLVAIEKLFCDIINFNKDVRSDKTLNSDFKKLLIDLNKYEPIMDFINKVFDEQDPKKRKYFVIGEVMLYDFFYSDISLKVIDENGFLDILEKDQLGMLDDYILKIIKKPQRSRFENNLLDYFFKNHKRFTFDRQNAVSYFLNQEPNVIAKYFSLILPLVMYPGDLMLDYIIIKKYSHLGWDKMIIAHFKDLVSVSSQSDQKTKLLNALSHIMSTKDFLDLVKDYIPTEKKLDLNNKEQSKIYKVQCYIAKIFKNLNEPLLLLPVIMDFSQGDYLQSSLPTLYKVLYRISEENASFYIDSLATRAVSARKHAVFLGFELLSVENSLTLYSSCSAKETNISNKKYLFDAMLKYYLKNPLKHLLETIIQSMNFIDKNDTEMIGRLVNSVNDVNNKDRPFLIENVWQYLDVLEQQTVAVMPYRNCLIDTINQREVRFVLRLNKNFCEDIIKKYFMLNNELLNSTTVNYFVINYLLAYLDDLAFEFVFSILKSYKETKDKNNKEHILKFFNNAYSKLDKNDVNFLKLFTSSWQRLYNHLECFSGYVLLKLMDLYKNNNNIECFSKEVDTFFQELVNEYGPYTNDLLLGLINEFFRYIFIKDNTDFNLGNFALYLLKSSSNDFNCFIAFKIIKNFSQKEIYSKVFDILTAVDKPTVKIYCSMLP